MKPSWSLSAQRFPSKTPQLEENTTHTHTPVELHIKPKSTPCDFSYNSSLHSKDSLGSSLLIWNRETEHYVWWRTCNIKCQDIFLNCGIDLKVSLRMRQFGNSIHYIHCYYAKVYKFTKMGGQHLSDKDSHRSDWGNSFSPPIRDGLREWLKNCDGQSPH